MKQLLEEIFQGRSLSVEESRSLMFRILSEEVPLSQVAALVTALRIRGVTVDVLDGFSLCLEEVAEVVHLDADEIVDVCGTGGDHKDTFNISTATAFVLAGAGYKVAKHGNSAVSSSCGSSNVLEALGVRLEANRYHLQRALDKNHICFLHAPLFHPALKRVAALRQELGFRTVFNALGPLINPARPTFQCSGVYDLELHRLYGYLLQRRGKKFAVVHSLDGYDEVSLTAPSRVTTRMGLSEITAKDFGFSPLKPEELRAPATVKDSAALIVDILEGRGTPAQEAVVISNAALAMWCNEERGELEEFCHTARESIRSGAARRSLQGSVEA